VGFNRCGSVCACVDACSAEMGDIGYLTDEGEITILRSAVYPRGDNCGGL
jgi:hypothetical protein